MNDTSGTRIRMALIKRARAMWAGNPKLQEGETKAALSGYDGYRAGRQVAPEWTQTYGSIVKTLGGR